MNATPPPATRHADPRPGRRADLRDAAARTVAQVAARLGDPESVVAATVANGTHAEVDDTRAPVWEAGSLNRGYPALVLLHAELGQSTALPESVRAAHRATAHRFLELTATATREQPVRGAFSGVGALASAVRVAAAHKGEYASMLARTDARMADYARRLVALHSSTRDAGLPTYSAVLDGLSGLSGIGRYLLHRRTHDDALRAALASLTALRDPLRVKGIEVPGWWYGQTSRTRVGEEFAEGQVNFGLAHGVPGPLALLSLAWSAGVRVPGQDETIAAMAEWLLDWREHDEAGPYWTPYLPLRYYADRGAHRTPQPARPSWCYGAAGTARALTMAARALDRPEWAAAGVEAVGAMARRPVEGWGIDDHMLCHGWSSTLLLLTLCELDHPEADLSATTDTVAERLLRGYEPDAPFGYRFFQPAGELRLDMPGFLDGATGIALALHTYATGRAPASGWDTLLLVN